MGRCGQFGARGLKVEYSTRDSCFPQIKNPHSVFQESLQRMTTGKVDSQEELIMEESLNVINQTASGGCGTFHTTGCETCPPASGQKVSEQNAPPPPSLSLSPDLEVVETLKRGWQHSYSADGAVP
jgi:hypothetical protein